MPNYDYLVRKAHWSSRSLYTLECALRSFVYCFNLCFTHEGLCYPTVLDTFLLCKLIV